MNSNVIRQPSGNLSGLVGEVKAQNIQLMAVLSARYFCSHQILAFAV